MIRLTNAATDLLSLTTAQNGAKVVVSFSDATSSNYLGDSTPTSITSATTTTICATPAASTVRDVDEINIKNTFAGSHTMTVNFSRGGTLYAMFTASLLQDESISYVHGSGWCALDANGNRKEVTSSVFTGITATSITLSGGSALSSYVSGTWTPIDSSGAGLSFTSVNARYYRIGDLVFAEAAFTYPSTASGAAAIIGGLPITVANQTYAQGPAPFGGNIGAAANVIKAIANTTTAAVVLATNTNTGTTNLVLTTASVFFTLIYPAV